MVFDAHKDTIELLLRYETFNADNILLIEHCYSLQGTLLT